jgi:opacity protein-like surface antigen
MKRHILLTVASTAVLTAVSLAGETTVSTGKSTVPPPAPHPVYGTGFYAGIDGGINAYQDFGGTRRFSFDGNDVAVRPHQRIGGWGGLKLGYVFGTGTVRPAIEADCYYNGLDARASTTVNGNQVSTTSGRIDSGAFLGNFLLRFSFDRFQPYVGAGIGGYVAQAHDISITAGGRTRSLESSGGRSDLAWQIVGGADYYFTEKLSAFIEYKFLNYEDGYFNDRVGQQLVGLGLRIHF